MTNHSKEDQCSYRCNFCSNEINKAWKIQALPLIETIVLLLKYIRSPYS